MRISRRKLLYWIGGTAALPALGTIARAERYPARPVRLILGYAPGAAPDIMCRLLGQWRSPALPDIPAVAEFVSGYEASSWHGLCAPKNTPRDIVDLVGATAKQILDESQNKARLARLGGTPLPLSSSEFADFIRQRPTNGPKSSSLPAPRSIDATHRLLQLERSAATTQPPQRCRRPKAGRT